MTTRSTCRSSAMATMRSTTIACSSRRETWWNVRPRCQSEVWRMRTAASVGVGSDTAAQALVAAPRRHRRPQSTGVSKYQPSASSATPRQSRDTFQSAVGTGVGSNRYSVGNASRIAAVAARAR